MVLQDAQQAVAAARRMLAVVRDGAVASAELRAALEQARVFIAAGQEFQRAAAELIAAREHHGDGGAEVLAVSAGFSQSEARGQLKTSQAIRKVPKLHNAVQSGEVSQANARRLADVITKTGADAVASDDLLLKQASSLRPEQFQRTAQQWINAHQADNGASEHARQRDRRYLRFYDSDDGMIAMYGEFDKITGTRIHNRIRHIAGKFLDGDKKLPAGDRRKFPQCMADALEHITTNTKSRSTARTAGRINPAGNTVTGRIKPAGRTVTGSKKSAHICDCGTSRNPEGGSADSCDCTAGGNAEQEAGGGWVADITLVAHVDDATGELIAELSDGSRLPSSVLEELSCNTRWTGLVYDRIGDAIWRSRSRRTVSESQWQALLADYGGCFHCGAPPQICQAHHIIPYSRGGATSVKNMVMVCWHCHHKIHHSNWRIETHDDGRHTLHPPNNQGTQSRYGPAHAEDPPAEPPSRRGRSPAHNKSRANRAKTSAKDPSPTPS